MAGRSKLNTTLIVAHRWLGLLAAVFLVLLALTGITNVFREAASPLIHSELMTVQPGTDRVELSDAILAVGERYPELSVVRAIFPQDPADAYVFRLKPRSGGVLWLAMVDPYTGQVLGGGPLYKFPLEAALYLHAELLLGHTGDLIVGCMGIALFLMVVSGLYLWWPRVGGFRNALQLGRGKPLTTFLLGLHKSPGALVAILLVVQSLTGSMVSFRSDLMPIVGVFTEVEMFPDLVPVDMNDSTRLREEILVNLAKARFPNSRLRDMRFVGGAPADVVGVTFFDDEHPRPRAVNSVWFDSSNGTILHTVTADLQPAGNQLLRWMLPIHNGRALGLTGRTIVVINGLSLLLLVTTGMILWIKRRRIRR